MATEAVDRLLADVPLDPDTPFDLCDFVDRLAAHRGRPLRLVPMSEYLSEGQVAPATGLLISLPHCDYIFYDDTVAASYSRVVCMHELGHLLLGHRARGELSNSAQLLLDILFPDLDPEMVRAQLGPVLCRDAFSDQPDLEEEAEQFGTVLLQRVAGRDVMIREEPDLAPADRQVVDRLAEVLGEHPHLDSTS
ncbi:Cinorf13 protein [Alloactinosynnema sp. L-07]|uniref:hypothetical protein n=1 Tax=Alloactinosynnema sp. L-07 TaxID=1653480 RepID=UPI00065EFD0B|nr:hypothetical protein [Alloactinosynnema sp. L-07]CRK57019.1 Cinorf13 protein [Alloactinosynnema sp. L-07]